MLNGAHAAMAVATAAEACRNSDLWADVAAEVAAALGADGAAFGLSSATGAFLMRHCPQTDPDFHARYDPDLHAQNYLWAKAATLGPGSAVTEGSLGGRDRYHRSVIYNEFIRPQRMDSTLTLKLTGPTTPVLALLTLGRRQGREAFGSVDLEDAGQLSAALARTVAACGIGKPHQGLGLSWRAEVLVTPQARVVERNGSLEPLLRAGVVEIIAGVLSVPQMPSLHIALAAAGRDSRTWPPPVSMVLGPVATSVGSLMLRLVPGGLSAPGAVRLVFENAPPEDPAAAFRTRYGLTARETEIALRLGAGDTLPDVAESLGIALTTARSHLSQLFDKTGTRSQLSLALLVAREAAS